MLRLDTIGDSPDKEVQRKRKSNDADAESSGSSDEDDGLDARLLRRDDATHEEEKELESMLFGSKTNMMADIEKKSSSSRRSNRNKAVKQVVASESAQPPTEIAKTFETRKPVWEDPDDQEVVDLNKYGNLSSLAPDSRTDKLTSSQIEDTLKAKYNKYFGTPMWADLESSKSKKLKKKKKKTDDSSSDEDDDDEEEQDDNDEFFQHTGNFLESTGVESASSSRLRSRTVLPKTNIEIKVCADANKEEPHQARLRSVEFHPSARVLLAAGLGQKLTLFQIDGKKNPKIQTIFFDKFPILAAHFTKQNGDEIVLGSRHKNFYYYDMHAGKMVCVRPPCKALDEHQRPSMSACFEISPDNRLMAFVGSQGQVHLFSTKSKEWIQTVKINQECQAIAFSSDSRYLFAFGDGKDVYVFDMNDRGKRCLNRFADEGCLSGTSIAVSPNSQFLATGCKSGVVNLYNLNESLIGGGGDKGECRNPRPVKTFMNLTTPCTSLKFNSTSEILAASSSFGENACKLIHTGSMTVFSNFPIQTGKSGSSSVHTRMRIPESVDFSQNSGYFTIGNNKGNALLYRLKHYGSY